MSDAKILIVEDEAIEALDIQQRLRTLGYAATDNAYSGEEAVKKAASFCPDLILMDIMLPGRIDGITAAERIHAFLDVPVIYLTAYADENTVRRAHITEPYGYIVKPFQDRDLQIAIGIALYKHNTEKKLRENDDMLRLASQAAGVGTFVYDWEKCTGYWSPELKTLLGLKTEEPVTMEANGMVVGMPLDSWAASLVDIKAATDPGGNGLYDNEYRLTFPDKSIRWLRVSGRIYFTGEGESRRPLRSAGAVVDITKLKLGQEELARHRDHLKEMVIERTQDLWDLNQQLEREIEIRAEREEELKLFPIRLIEGQEKERRAIGREFHDQTGQYLTALKLLLSKESHNHPADTGLKEAIQLTDEILQQVREMSHNLRPPMIDELGLVATLIWQFERMTTQTGLRINFKHSGLEGRKISADVNLTAFRIIQEAVTNVIRHAGSNQTDVLVKATPQKLHIRVTDKGRGFNPEDISRSVSSGLTSMKERTALLSGHFNVKSSSGRGTTISVELPLVREKNGKRNRKAGKSE